MIIKDRSYVVCMQNITILANCLLCFEFSHQNRQLKSNERQASLSFQIGKNCEVRIFFYL